MAEIGLQDSAHTAARCVHVIEALTNRSPELDALLAQAKTTAAGLLRRYADAEPNERNARMAREQADRRQGLREDMRVMAAPVIERNEITGQIDYRRSRSAEWVDGASERKS